MNNPKISVIVPVYNAEKYLHKCIDSILAQTFTNFELLLIDDGSKDSSGSICDEYANKDTRIRVFHKPNGGVSSARNMGLNNTRARYVTFVDSDDWVQKDMFYSMLSCVETNENGTVLCGVERLTGRKTFVVHFKRDENFPSVDEYLLHYEIGYATWGVLYEQDHIERMHIRFNEELIMSEDCVFNMQYFATYEGSIYCIMKKMYIYNDKNPNSVCRTIISMDKCLSQIKSSIMVAKIPARGGETEKYFQKVSKDRYKFSLIFLSLLTPPLWEYYTEAYDNIRHPGPELWFARHFLFAYLQYRIIGRKTKHFLIRIYKSITNHRKDE